jgi:Holliday junction DNA helicase RuvA
VYSYLRGVYKGQPDPDSGSILLEVSGIGYELLVPPVVEQEIVETYQVDDPLLLHVSAVASRDQPWPQLFGFLRPQERALWDLLRSVPRLGGKGAVRAMSLPVSSIARAIQEGNKPFLDGLPGVTLDGAERIIASLRKKVGPFVHEEPEPLVARAAGANELQTDAVDLLVVMGVRRPDAQRGVDQLLGERDDLIGVEDVIREYLRVYHNRTAT